MVGAMAESVPEPQFRTLEDDDPLWEQHCGGPGHRDHPEWSADDGPLASVFYADTVGRPRAILDLLIYRPGQLVDADRIAEQALSPGRAADRTGRRRAVALVRGPRRFADAVRD
jgi:hypothetical protein